MSMLRLRKEVIRILNFEDLYDQEQTTVKAFRCHKRNIKQI